jgi:hypothetical protein
LSRKFVKSISILIYRLHPDGMAEAVWLLDAEDRPVVEYHFGYGGVRSFGAD